MILGAGTTFQKVLETLAAWMLGVLWALPLLYAAWAAFHLAGDSTRFDLTAPLTWKNFAYVWAAARMFSSPYRRRAMNGLKPALLSLTRADFESWLREHGAPSFRRAMLVGVPVGCAFATKASVPSLLVPLGNVLMAATGSWHAVFMTAATMNIVAALLALFMLKPMRALYTSKMPAADPGAKWAIPEDTQ